MKKTFSLLAAMMCVTAALFTSCDPNEPKANDPTKFSTKSIVGIWACVASDNKTYDFMTGEYEYSWDYDPDAEMYDVEWYFDIQSNSKVQYVELKSGKAAQYRKSDNYLHIAEDSQWKTVADANYIFDQERQVIRCTSGTFFGFSLESVEYFLGNDTIFRVQRKGLDEAIIFDNTGFIQSQYVFRAKGIKKDL